MQGHEVALDKLPSKVAAVVPREQLERALSAAGLPAKGARFVNLAELAALEALQVMCHCPCLTASHVSCTFPQLLVSRSGIACWLVPHIMHPSRSMHLRKCHLYCPLPPP